MEPDDPGVEAVELHAVQDLADMDLRPPIAEHLIDALDSPEGFLTRYVGSVVHARA